MSAAFLRVADSLMNQADPRWRPLIGKRAIVVDIDQDGFLDILIPGELDGGQRFGVARERFVVEKVS